MKLLVSGDRVCFTRIKGMEAADTEAQDPKLSVHVSNCAPFKLVFVNTTGSHSHIK